MPKIDYFQLSQRPNLLHRRLAAGGVIGAVLCAAFLGATPAQGAPADVVAQAAANAAANGVTAYISVVDRDTGAVVGETGNAGTQVGSESIYKLMLASYYLVLYGGYQSTPSNVLDQLSYMLRLSDNGVTNSLFTANAVPTIAARYGMASTTNATDRAGHWGAARITAHDMASFLWRASQDPAVGPWLIPVMAQTAPNGSDGFNQAFGLNSLSGIHGSKQGWGNDSFFTPQHNAIHSVGYTDQFYVAILQTAGNYPDPMRATSSTAARLIQASTSSPGDGQFVLNSADGTVYRMAGGAPVYVSDFAAVPGSTAYRVLSGADFAALRQYPLDGTLLQAGNEIYVMAGGAPIYVSEYAPIGGYRPAIQIDPAAVARAGSGGQWSHLSQFPADGTLLQNGSQIFVVAGGAPLFVSQYAPIGGFRPAVRIDPTALNDAGAGGPWNHLRFRPADGTLLQAGDDGSPVYITAGGAPTYVTNYASIGGPRRAVRVDPASIGNGGSPGLWVHLSAYPVDGTLLQAGPDGSEIYLMAGGAPTYLSDYGVVGGPRPAARVDPVQIADAGTGGYFNHLRFRPADGTLLRSGLEVYVAAGGAPVYVSNYAAIGGPRPSSTVDPAAVANSGGVNQWSHLNGTPADGTLLQAGAPGAAIYVAAGGAPIYLASFADIGGSRPAVVIDAAAIDDADNGGKWNHVHDVPVDGTLLHGSPGSKDYRVTAGRPKLTADSAGAVTVSQAAIDKAGQPGVWSHLRPPINPAAARAADVEPTGSAQATTAATDESTNSAIQTSGSSSELTPTTGVVATATGTSGTSTPGTSTPGTSTPGTSTPGTGGT